MSRSDRFGCVGSAKRPSTHRRLLRTDLLWRTTLKADAVALSVAASSPARPNDDDPSASVGCAPESQAEPIQSNPHVWIWSQLDRSIESTRVDSTSQSQPKRPAHAAAFKKRVCGWRNEVNWSLAPSSRPSPSPRPLSLASSRGPLNRRPCSFIFHSHRDRSISLSRRRAALAAR